MDDKYYLRLAYERAAELSTDPSTQNGALIAPFINPHGWVFGVNRFPNGVAETPERWQRPSKYSYVEHAERNAIYQAAELGVATRWGKMYCPWFACCECARAIIQSGIREVVGHDCELHKTQTHWVDTVKLADGMLQEAGVTIRRVPAKFGIKIRFGGQLVEV